MGQNIQQCDKGIFEATLPLKNNLKLMRHFIRDFPSTSYSVLFQEAEREAENRDSNETDSTAALLKVTV